MSKSDPSPIQDAPKSFVRRLGFIGPSLIITATLVGSGELLATTTFGAKAGFVSLWLIIGACLIKVALQEALGRYTISSGETTLKALSRLPGPPSWAIWFWLIVIFVTSIQLGGVSRVVGEAIKLLLQQSGHTEFIWGPIVCGVCLLILLVGRYKTIERTSTILVSLFSIATLICAAAIQWTPNAIRLSELASGFRFELPAEGSMMALGIVAIVGLSSSELVYYGYWCLEKGYARWTGPNDGSEAWQQRANGWIRVMHIDCVVGFLIYTTTTIAFYLLGAAVLHRAGVDPGEGIAVLEPLSEMYTQTIGPWAFYVFLGSALLVLFSTLLVSIASYARLVPDALRIIANRKSTESEKERSTLYGIILFSILFAVMSQIQYNPVFLVVVGTSGIALLLPVIALAAVYLRYKRLDPKIAPGLILDLWLWVSAILTVVITCHALWKTIAGVIKQATE